MSRSTSPVFPFTPDCPVPNLCLFKESNEEAEAWFPALYYKEGKDAIVAHQNEWKKKEAVSSTKLLGYFNEAVANMGTSAVVILTDPSVFRLVKDEKCLKQFKWEHFTDFNLEIETLLPAIQRASELIKEADDTPASPEPNLLPTAASRSQGTVSEAPSQYQTRSIEGTPKITNAASTHNRSLNSPDDESCYEIDDTLEQADDHYATPEHQQTVPQDPAKPLLDSSESEDEDLETLRELFDYGNGKFTSVWSHLNKKMNWTYKKAWNALDDFFYISPNAPENPKANGVRDRDYFTQASLWDYLSKRFGTEDCETPAKRSLDYPEDSPSTKLRKDDEKLRDLMKRGKFGPVWNQLKHMSWKKRGNKFVHADFAGNLDEGEEGEDYFKSELHLWTYLRNFFHQQDGSVRIPSKPNSPKQPTYNHNFWKSKNLPSIEEVWPILEKLDFERKGDRYTLPGADATLTETGLRKLLCLVGIPKLTPTKADEVAYQELPEKYTCPSLTYNETLLVTRWVRFANVPVHHHNSKKILARVTSPSKDAGMMRLLHKLSCLGFHFCDGNIFLPVSTVPRSLQVTRFSHSSAGGRQCSCNRPQGRRSLLPCE